MAETLIPTYIKDPAAILDYTWLWADWLADIDDAIASATVTVPDGIAKVGDLVVSTTAVTAKISGGVLGEEYLAVCQIVTADGLVDERSIRLTIQDR